MREFKIAKGLCEVKGECIGVRLEPRNPSKDQHICFSILIEDDEEWHKIESSISSHWLGELIEVLTAAKEYCETQKPDIDPTDEKQYGWKFKHAKDVR